MSSEDNAMGVTFKEDPLGAHKEENAPPIEADPQKSTSETAALDGSSESKTIMKQEVHDMGTVPPCHPDIITSSASELSSTCRNEPRIKQEVPTFDENGNLTDQSFQGFLIDLPKQEISGLEVLFTGPITSLAREIFSETNMKENAPHLEASPQIAVSESAMHGESCESQLGTLPLCHPDKRSSIASESNSTLHDEPPTKQEMPTENKNMTDQLFKGLQIDMPRQEISGLERAFTDPVISLVMEILSETNIKENAPSLEADPQIAISETAVQGESSESKVIIRQEDNDMGTLPLCHPDKRSSAASELNVTLHDETPIKKEVPTFPENKNMMNQFFRGFQIDLPKQEFSGIEGMLMGPVTSIAMELFSEIKVTEEEEVANRLMLNHGLLPPLTPQHLPVGDYSVRHDQLPNNCDEEPSANAPPLVQCEVAMLDGHSDSEPQMQPEPLGYDSTSEEVISEVEGVLSSPVNSPAAEVFSEVDESPDLDEKNLPDGSSKKLSYPQFPLHQPVGINYAFHEQSQNHWVNLPLATPQPGQHNVVGCSSSTLRFPPPELLAIPKDEYCQKSNPSNAGLPLTQQTSVSASSSAFAKPPGWYASVRANNTYQPPSFIPTGVHTAADRMLYLTNWYNNNGSTPAITGHRRPREGEQNLADQIPFNDLVISTLSGSAYQQLTKRQVLGAQIQTPSVTPLSINGSPISSSNIEANGISQYGLPSPAPGIHPWFSLGQYTTRPTQIQKDPHQAIPNGMVAPSTGPQRLSLPVPNALYNPSYEQLGLPVDPILRAFHEYNLGNNNNNNNVG